MKAIVYGGPGNKAWEDVPEPGIQEPTDAIVKVECTTICGTDLHILKGDVPSPLNPPTGCRFHTRCWLAQEICKQQIPVWRNVAQPGQTEHFVACHFAPFTKMPMPGEGSDTLGKNETMVVHH